MGAGRRAALCNFPPLTTHTEPQREQVPPPVEEMSQAAQIDPSRATTNSDEPGVVSGPLSRIGQAILYVCGHATDRPPDPFRSVVFVAYGGQVRLGFVGENRDCPPKTLGRHVSK